MSSTTKKRVAGRSIERDTLESIRSSARDLAVRIQVFLELDRICDYDTDFEPEGIHESAERYLTGMQFALEAGEGLLEGCELKRVR
jgi:hypothetical protein